MGRAYDPFGVNKWYVVYMSSLAEERCTSLVIFFIVVQNLGIGSSHRLSFKLVRI